MNTVKTGLMIALLAACGSLAAQEVAYRWVDEEGVTHFSDRPPADTVQPDILEIPDYQPPATPAFSYVAMLERLESLERELAETREAAARPTPAPVVVQPVHTRERAAAPVFFPHRHRFRHAPPHPDTPARTTPSSRFDRLADGVRDRYRPPEN